MSNDLCTRSGCRPLTSGESQEVKRRIRISLAHALCDVTYLQNHLTKSDKEELDLLEHLKDSIRQTINICPY